ncbi:MAG: ABC transporter substrate-binding protein [Crocinitomicaceae bacterium]
MRSIYLVLFLALLASSCNTEEKQQFEHAGGSFSLALNNEPATHIPRNVTDYYSSTVLMQINECLVGMDPKTTKIVPRLAKKWTVSDNGTTYEFTLRDNVYFHEHEVFSSMEDRLMTTDDVIKTFEIGCKKDADGNTPATYAYMLKSLVKGADDYHNGKAKTIKGITAKGNKIKFELLNEDHNFLYKLAYITASIVSKKMIEANAEGEAIGTGPFKYTKYEKGEQPAIILTKNEDYYLKDDQGNALPYLDSLVFYIQSRKLEQLDMFETGKTDLIVGLPTSRITRMLEGRIQDFNSKPPKLILANNPLLESNYYFFNMNDPRFKDPRVRKAFNYAINRESIGREILRNQYSELGYYGITPPVSKTLKGYDFDIIKEKGYTYNPELARQLLAEAGYPNGEGFGSVELRYNINDTHSAVADEVSKQVFQVLGININIDGSTFEQLNLDGEMGVGDIFRMGWSADYPHPETFLMNFYGRFIPDDSTARSSINKSRYRNPIFDDYYSKAREASKITDQLKYFNQAEVALMDDPPIIPLWYTGDIEITYSRVRNFHFNAINIFDFTRVYLKEWTEEEYEKHMAKKNS